MDITTTILAFVLVAAISAIALAIYLYRVNQKEKL